MSEKLNATLPKAEDDTSNLRIYSVNGLINIQDPSNIHNSDSIHKLLFGVSGDVAFDYLLNQITDSMSGNDNDYKLNSILPLLRDLAPKDSLEGMLAIQMITAHNMAMEMTRRALLPDQSSQAIDSNLNRANKLMRTFKNQLETLQKYRNKGQQTIQVQYVTVNDGGQAIVGNHKGGRGNE